VEGCPEKSGRRNPLLVEDPARCLRLQRGFASRGGPRDEAGGESWVRGVSPGRKKKKAVIERNLRGRK